MPHLNLTATTLELSLPTYRVVWTGYLPVIIFALTKLDQNDLEILITDLEVSITDPEIIFIDLEIIITVKLKLPTLSCLARLSSSVAFASDAGKVASKGAESAAIAGAE